MSKKILYIDGSSTETIPEPTAGKYLQRNAIGDNYEWTDAILQAHEIIPVTAAGQTEFDLTNTPLDGYAVQMFVNGIKQEIDTEYQPDDATVTYLGDLTLYTTDNVEFWYVYLETPAQIDDLEMWWGADFTAAQGTVTEAASPEVFTTIVNRGGYGGIFDSAGAMRPFVAHLEAGGISRKVATFEGSVSSYHVSSLSAASWAKSHQEWTWSIAARPVGAGAFVATARDLNTIIGFFLLYDDANERVRLWICDGSGAYVLAVNTSNNSVPLNAVTILTVRYSDAFGWDIRANGVSVGSAGALTRPVSGSDPWGTLYVGRAATGGHIFDGNICEIFGYSRVLTTDEVVKLENHLSNKYQNQAAPLDYAPTFWLRSDLGYELRTEYDSGITVWNDLSGNAHNASQTDTDKQLTLDPSDSDFNNHSSMEGNGIEDNMELSAGAGWPAGTNHSFLAVIDQDDAAGTISFLFDTQTGRLALAPLTDVAGQLGASDGGWLVAGAAVAGPQEIEWHFDDTANTFDVYRAGVFVGSAAYATARAIGATTTIFTNYLENAAYFDGKVSELWHRDSLLTGEDLFNVRSYLAERYPELWEDTLPLLSPDCATWLNPTIAGNVEVDGANRVGAVQDTSVTREEVLTNGDMETGTPPDDWIDWGGGTSTAQPGARTGGSGLQVLRNTILVADTGGGTYQDSMTVGARYRAAGWARGDGVSGHPRLYTGTTTVLQWIGTSSNTWQQFSAVFVTGSARSSLYTAGAIPTEDYVEWDDISIVRAADAIQISAADQPLWVADAGDGVPALRFDGGNSELLKTAIVPNATEGTVFVQIRATPDVNRRILGANDAGTSKYLLITLVSDGKIQFTIGNSGEGIASVATVTPGAWNDIIVWWKSGEIGVALNEIAVTSAVTRTPTIYPLYIGCRNANGSPVGDSYFDGDIGQCLVFDRALSATEIATLRENTERDPWIGTPKTIPDLSGWWDVSDTSTHTITAGRMSTLADKSGLGRDLTEVGTDGPTYEAIGWDGRPSILFSGIHEYMTADAVATDFAGDDKPLTIIMAMQWISFSSDAIWAFGDGTNANFFRDSTDGANNWLINRRVSFADINAVGGAATLDRIIHTTVFPGVTVSTYNNNIIDLDAAALNTAALPVTNFTVGARQAGAVDIFANIRVAEIIIYKRALSITERQDVEAYLTRKWGVS